MMDTLEDGEILEEGEIIEDDNVGNNQAVDMGRHKSDSGDMNNHHNNHHYPSFNNNLHATTSAGLTNGKENIVRRFKDCGGTKNLRYSILEKLFEFLKLDNSDNHFFRDEHTSNNIISKKKRKQKQSMNYGSRKRKADDRLPPSMKLGKHHKFKVALNGTSGKGILDILDITQWLLDDTFDEEELENEEQYNLDSLNFDSLLETLGCSAPTFQFDTITEAAERKRLMFRIIKIVIFILKGNNGKYCHQLYSC